MQCEYFGKCGGCSLGGLSYDEQLNLKVNKEKDRFVSFWNRAFDVFKSENEEFRNRAEFRLWKIFDNEEFSIHYAMNDTDKNILPIKNCKIVNISIGKLMPKLLFQIQISPILNHKIFSIEFLSSSSGDILVTLIYHKNLDNLWIDEAKNLETMFGIKIIGRSRRQKIILSEDFICDILNIKNQTFKFKYKEGGFTQPNQKVNIQMIEWVLDNIICKNDLCELYCGGGNFTIPLSKCFDKVIATEISKTSIASAKINCDLNDIKNIKFIRMSSEEFVDAKNGKRDFRRLIEDNINLNDYNFSTIFVDPPRAGLDSTTRKLASDFFQIIYISCNTETLNRDLADLLVTHDIQKFALFDQFAYSHHIESGVILTKKLSIS